MSQNANNTYRIPAPDDARLLDLLTEIADLLGQSFSLSLPGAQLGTYRDAMEVKAAFPNRDWSNNAANYFRLDLWRKYPSRFPSFDDQIWPTWLHGAQRLGE